MSIAGDLELFSCDSFANQSYSRVYNNGQPWCQQFDINTSLAGDFNTAEASLPTVGSFPHRVAQASVFIAGNKIYKLCGQVNGTTSNTIYSCSLTEDPPVTWVLDSYFPLALYSSCVFVLADKVYIIAGYPYAGRLFVIGTDSSGITGSWTELTSTGHTPYSGDCIVTNNVVYIIGGSASSVPSALTRYARIYPDGTLSPWVLGESLVAARYNFRLARVGTKVYLIGGYNGGAKNNVYVADIDATGLLINWASYGTIPTARTEASVYVTRNNVFLLGGVSTEVIYAAINSDYSLGSWQTGKPMASEHRSSFLFTQNKKIFIIGHTLTNDTARYITSTYITDNTSNDAWDSNANAHSYYDVNAGVMYVSLEAFTGEFFFSAFLQADLELWTASLQGAEFPFIQADFQLWNGSFGGNLVTISGTLLTWDGEISGVFAFNSVLASFKSCTASFNCGAQFSAELEQFSGFDATGTVGQLLGFNAYFVRWAGDMYAGARTVDPMPEISMLTGSMSGTTTHVNRVSASMPLFSMTGSGYIGGSGQVSASLESFNSSLSGRIINPATIRGSLETFTMAGRASKTQQIELEGEFIFFSGRISGRDTSPGNVSGSFELFNANIRRSFICVKEAAATNQTVKFDGGLGL